VAAFKKGQSGNPTGKPKGAKDKRTELRELLKPHAAKLVKKVVDLALAGDVSALRICIDRIIPPVRENRLSIALPVVKDVAGCTAAQAKVLQAVTKGDLLPGEAEALSSLIEHQRRGLESHDLAARVLALEGKSKPNQKGNAP
jgi:hypothetical protein